VSSFRLQGFDLDPPTGRVALRYALGDDFHFEELVQLPPAVSEGAVDDAVLERGARLLHLVAGVSYYKAAAPGRIELEDHRPGRASLALAAGLYGPGLAEFRFVNGLELDPGDLFPTEGNSNPPTRAPGGAQRSTREPSLGERALVPVGGGKDSVVSMEAMKRAGMATTLFSVGDAAPIRATAQVSGLERRIAVRRIDPRLLELNERGALNGHVPVTAIVSVIACLVALRGGERYVVLSNERSARAGSVLRDGIEVNHQWSKGLEAEQLLRAALREDVCEELECFSLLRGASELAIARAFARLPAYHADFTSCNRVFRLDPARRAENWCGECPKCRFVFLALAPWMSPAALQEIFGANLLDEPAQHDGFYALLGEGASKPFECVGEVAESIAAFRLLAQAPRWRDAAVVRRVGDEVLAHLDPAVGRPEDVLALSGEHCIPPGLEAVADAALAA
jgi:hypothetical protein